MGTPSAEVNIDVELVRSLLQSQHPDLAHLPIRPAASGWDNALFCLGERWAVRLPRRQQGAALIEKEQTWLPVLAPQLTLPVPLPYRCGEPGSGYPWQWSVVPWMAGDTADKETLGDGEAKRLAVFLRSLHTPAPTYAPISPYRGVPLTQRSALVAEWMASLNATPDALTPAIYDVWQRALAAPIATAAKWLHGDLHPHNILSKAGVITGVIDWGDLTAGDVATDLAAIWMLFEQGATRDRAFDVYGADAATRLRAQGWAVFFATILLKTGRVDNPSHAAIGRNTLRRLASSDA
ncbi:MAG: aminoglycoside phosphotransferase family protein [Cyanobacteria bacterium J06598_1]